MRPFEDVDLHAYVDNQLGPNRREAIEAYLKQRPAEAERVARWQGQTRAIQSAFGGVASEPVPLWLTLGQITTDRAKPDAAKSVDGPAATRLAPLCALKSGARRRISPVVGIVLAFAIGLSVPYAAARWPALAGYRLLAEDATPRQTFERRALDAHNTFGTDLDSPVDVIDSPAGTLKRWLERRVPFSVSIPDLRMQGWTLRGGRTAPADQGPGALLVYENGLGDRLSLFMSRVSGLGEVEPANANGVLSWSEGPVAYAIVTSRSPNWLARNARQLASAVRGVPPTD